MTIEKKRGAISSPRIAIRDSPERDELDVPAVLQEHAKQAGILHGLFLIGMLDQNWNAMESSGYVYPDTPDMVALGEGYMPICQEVVVEPGIGTVTTSYSFNNLWME